MFGGSIYDNQNPLIVADDMWKREAADYDCATGKSKGGEILHFTQQVWKGTTAVGCGVAKGANGATYVACNYSPPGNVTGAFTSNVLC